MNIYRTPKVKDNLYDVVENSGEIIVLDTETTGLDADKERIIQISGIKYSVKPSGDKMWMEEKDRFDIYINPGYCIPPIITELTGITDDTVKDCGTEDEIFEDTILKFFGESPECIAGYNIPFDRKFIDKMYERNGRTFDPKHSLDVLEMARDVVDPKDCEHNPKTGRAIYKLGLIAPLYGADTGLTFHNSMDDVIATGRLIPVFYSEYKEYDREMEEKREHQEKANIISINYWQGYRGLARIYINTDIGGFYYDITKRTWNVKKDTLLDITCVDMEDLRQKALSKVGAKDDAEFASIMGKRFRANAHKNEER